MFIGLSFPRNTLQPRADVARAPPTAVFKKFRLDILSNFSSVSSGIITLLNRNFKIAGGLTKVVRINKLSI
jgi:hypothetical protein